MINNETGRSMVEMLTVLAVVAILSVVGMMGFGRAMDKNRANTIINEAQKRAVLVLPQLGNENLILTEFTNNELGYATFDTNVAIEGLTDQFGIRISGVSKSICQNLLNVLGEKTPIRRLSKEDTITIPITSCDDTGNYVIIYNNNMKGEESDTEYCESDENCGACGICSSTTHLCEGECTPPENDCDDDTECNEKNECMICDTQTHKCKDGCERVEYLESTRTQYIDTGVIGKDGVLAEINVMKTTNKTNECFVGAWDSGSNRCWLAYAFGGKWYPGYDGSSGGLVDVNINEWTTIKSYTEVSAGKNYFGYNVNGTNYRVTGNYSTFTGSNSIMIFAMNTNDGADYKATGRIKRVKLTDNGKLVRDFIPVKSPKGNCMFNRVKEDGKLKLYCSETETDFIVP